MGDLSTELDQIEDAKFAYQKAIQIDSAFFPGAWYFLAKLEYETGNYHAAIINYYKYLQFTGEPEHTRSLAIDGLNTAYFAEDAVNNPTANAVLNIGSNINTTADEYINFVNETSRELILTRKAAGYLKGSRNRMLKKDSPSS